MKGILAWTGLILPLSLILTGCKEKKFEEATDSAPVEETRPTAKTAPAEGTVTPARRGPEDQEKPKGDVIREGSDVIKEGAQGDVIRP